MKPEQIKFEVERLDLSEKITLVEDIWDSIAESDSELPMPLWQKEELNKRYEDYQKGKLLLHSSEDINESIRKKINEA